MPYYPLVSSHAATIRPKVFLLVFRLLCAPPPRWRVAPDSPQPCFCVLSAFSASLRLCGEGSRLNQRRPPTASTLCLRLAAMWGRSLTCGPIGNRSSWAQARPHRPLPISLSPAPRVSRLSRQQFLQAGANRRPGLVPPLAPPPRQPETRAGLTARSRRPVPARTIDNPNLAALRKIPPLDVKARTAESECRAKCPAVTRSFSPQPPGPPAVLPAQRRHRARFPHAPEQGPPQAPKDQPEPAHREPSPSNALQADAKTLPVVQASGEPSQYGVLGPLRIGAGALPWRSTKR